MNIALVNTQFNAIFGTGREPGDPDDFQPPDLADVCLIRLEIERKKRRENEADEIRRRNREATPVPFVHTPTPYPEL